MNTGNSRCPVCGPDVEAGRAALRRSRRNRITILAALLCAAIAFVLIWPIISTSPPTESEELIITVGDLGPGWTGTKPSLDPITSNEGTRPAEVRLAFENDSSFSEVTCHLYIYSSTDLANVSYQESIQNMTGGSLLNIGDRAVLEADMNESQVVQHWLLTMQKGKVVVWMSALSYDGPIITEAQMIDLAEIQADKLP